MNLPSPLELAALELGERSLTEHSLPRDPSQVEAAIDSGVRFVLDLNLLAELDDDARSRLDGAEWWPLLVLHEMSEIESLAELVANNSLGHLLDLDLAVVYGAPGWDLEPTQYTPSSAFEAAVVATHLAQVITDRPVEVRDWVSPDEHSEMLIAGATAERTMIRLRVLPSRVLPVPACRIDLWFTDGHATMGNPLSPGSIDVWSATDHEMVSRGIDVGPTAGADRWAGKPLQRVVRWLAGEAAAQPDALGLLRSAALELIVATGQGWPPTPDD